MKKFSILFFEIFLLCATFTRLQAIPVFPTQSTPTFYVDDHVDVINGEFRESSLDLSSLSANGDYLLRQYHSSSDWDFSSKDDLPQLSSSFTWERKGENESFTLDGGQNISYEWETDPHSSSPRIKQAKGTFCPPCEYFYSSTSSRLIRIKFADGSCLEVDYYEEGENQVGDERVLLEKGDWRIGRVREERSPVGVDLEPKKRNFFFYSRGLTRVVDTNGNQSEYLYDDTEHLTEIRQSLGGMPYRSERLIWKKVGSEKKLVARLLIGQWEQIIAGRQFVYNDEGKIVQDILVGNLTGHSHYPLTFDEETLSFSPYCETDTTRYSYDSSAKLIGQTCQDGLEVRYRYETEKVVSKRVFDKGLPLYRFFYTYDQQGNKIRSVSDNGIGEEEKDLLGVTERKISEIESIQNGPYQGRPERTLEKVFDLEKGEEILRKETHLFYSPTGRRVEVFEYGADGSPLPMCWWEEDEQGHVLKEGAEKQTLAWYEYDIWGHRIAESKANQTTENRSVYDSTGHLLFRSRKDENGKEEVQRLHYDSSGNLVSRTNQFDIGIEYSYDALGRLTTVIYPHVFIGPEIVAQPEMNFFYNEMNQVVSTIDACGFETQWEYNIRGQPSRIFYPDRTTETFSYKADGTIIERVGRTGIRQVYEHDGLQRLLSTKTYSAQGDLLESVREEEGEPLSIPALPSPFSALNRPRTLPSTNTVSQEREVFLPSGVFVLEIESVTAEGRICLIQKDALGRTILEEEKGPFGEELQKTEKYYDLNGNLALEIHEKIYGDQRLGSYQIEWLHGPFGRVEELVETGTEGVLKRTRYFYNDLGQLDTLMKPDGNQLFYHYDAWGRLSVFTDAAATFAYQYLYNDKSRIEAVYDLLYGIDQTRSYHSSGKVEREQLAPGVEVESQFDSLGRCQEVTLPDGSGIKYKYKGFHIEEIQRLSPNNVVLYRHEVLKTSSKHFPLKAKLIHEVGTVEWSFDEMGRPQSMTSPFVEEKIVDRNEEGSPLSLKRKDPLGSEQISYSYDGKGQCVSHGGSQPFSCSYDSLGNRIDPTETSSSINGLNQQIRKNKQQFVYDANGNLVLETKGDQTKSYGYDGLNRLIRVAFDETVIEYRYDSFDRRIAQKISSPTEERLEYFVYQGYDEIGSWTPGEGFSSLRILCPGWGGGIGATVAIEKQGDVFAPLHDLRGNIVALINCKTRKCEEFYRLTLFGVEKIFNGQGAEIQRNQAISPWRFANKRVDAETGFVFFGKRYYLPEMGRWLTADPLGFADGPSLYQFVHNNPFQSVDLYGLISWNGFWESFTNKAEEIWHEVQAFFEKSYYFFEETLSRLHSLRKGLDSFFEEFAEKVFLALSGYYIEPPYCGVWGEGEVDQLVRVSFINGLFNIHEHCLDIVKMISEAHGFVNVHYVFRPTNGWSWDLFYGFKVKMGIASEYAKQLAVLWKKLIEDMGGADSGGVIFHYAHSLGVADTFAAKDLLVTEEKKMIHVIAFGSANLTYSDEFASVVHYLTTRDIVPLISDTAIWSKAFFDESDYVHFLESYSWIPFVDHWMISSSYHRVCKEKGQKFVDLYGRVVDRGLVDSLLAA